MKLLDIEIASIFGEEKKILIELDRQFIGFNFLKEDYEEFKVALAEICINSIEYGNQEDRQKTVHVVVNLFDNLIQAQVTDLGDGYVNEEKKDSERGWGLKIVQQFVDNWSTHHQEGERSRFSTKIEKHLRNSEF